MPSAQAVPAYGTIDLPVTGAAGVPASGVTAVTMNVTAVDPAQGGHLTVYPHGDAAPTASNLNWTPGRTVANLVTVPVKDGKVSFYNHSAGTVHLVADLAGYFGTEGRLAFHPGGPRRVMDTRVGQGSPNSHPAAPVPAWGTLAVRPSYGSYPPGVTLNVTVTEPGAEGHLTVYPQGGPAPGTSNLNFLRGETISNQVVVPTGGDTVLFYNASDAPVHLVVDYYGAERY
ncbi:hypothetical protein ACIGZJ_08485 [Kitasatospora sp. NPDC052868]|uniref:hypothetical protein n=1 Tax=Kitasatospora sp. NPDC052868 TaxID=3364060 RepID=UPI0037C8E69D